MLSVTGVISSFLLFWFFNSYQGLPRGEVQTAMFLKLLVAGHMTLYLTRSPGWMWQKPRPNLWMFLALEGTQITGTLVAVYGLLVTSITWITAGIVWAYAIVWILILDAVKRITYRILHKVRVTEHPKGKAKREQQ